MHNVDVHAVGLCDCYPSATHHVTLAHGSIIDRKVHAATNDSRVGLTMSGMSETHARHPNAEHYCNFRNVSVKHRGISLGE